MADKCPLGHAKDEAQPCGVCAGLWQKFVSAPDMAISKLLEALDEEGKNLRKCPECGEPAQD